LDGMLGPAATVGAGVTWFAIDATCDGGCNCIVRDDGEVALEYTLLPYMGGAAEARRGPAGMAGCEAALLGLLLKAAVWAGSRSLADGDGRDTV
jgi:hypothetical protein